MRKFWILILIVVFVFSPFFNLVQAAPTSTPIQQGLSITIEVPGTPTPTPTPTASPSPTPTPTPTPTESPPPGDGGGGGGVAPPTTAIFKGKAYPLAFITLLKNGIVTATFQAEASGNFEKRLTGISGGVHTFGIWAEDTEGRKSVTLSFSISLISGTTTTIEGIFISPTISLSPTQVERGGIVGIAGQVFPKSEVNIFVASDEIVKIAPADEKGKWDYKLGTDFLAEGEHSARAKALFGEGEQSPFSQTLPFLVVKPGAMICKGADLNFDGKVNIIDFSILLYFWGQRNPSNRCADINFDGIVNIIDFSIMMYWWSK